MTIAITLTFLALAMLAAVYFIARGQAASVRELKDLRHATEPVDMEAFAALLGEEDREFLRASLPGSAFRKVERRRTLAALEYVGRISRNAATLIRLGEAAQQSADPQVVAAGRQLAALAVRVRLNALRASGKLYFALLVPNGSKALGSVASRYRDLIDAAMRLGRLQQPSLAGHVGSAL